MAVTYKYYNTTIIIKKIARTKVAGEFDVNQRVGFKTDSNIKSLNFNMVFKSIFHKSPLMNNLT